MKYQPLEVYSNYQSDGIEVQELDLKDIKESNINFVVPELDEFCTPESSQRIFYELGTQDKTIRYVRDNAGLAPDHKYFSQVTGERFI